jgi:hypothetical protein
MRCRNPKDKSCSGEFTERIVETVRKPNTTAHFSLDNIQGLAALAHGCIRLMDEAAELDLAGVAVLNRSIP